MINFSQIQIFGMFFIIGVLIGIIFDLFRSVRKNYKSNDIATLFQDIIFLIISGSIIVFSIIKLNNGNIRLFIFIGILFGNIFYFLTISNFCVIILTIFVKICKEILRIPINCYIYLKNICKQHKKKDF